MGVTKAANYRVTIALGTGKDGELFTQLCDSLAEKLGMKNYSGQANYSALFRRAVESLAKELGVERGTA